MNTTRIQNAINEIILDVKARGWKANKTTKKALARIDELGLTSYIPAWMTRHGEKADIYINEIIAQAEQAGKTVTRGIMLEDGQTWEEVTPASELYLALLNEPEATPDPEPTVTLTDAQQVEAWMQQEAPAASELTEDDLTCLIVAHDVLRGYQMTRNTYSGFNFEQWIFASPTREEHLKTMRMIERGFAVLSGYVLCKTNRCPIWTDPTPAPEAVISAVHSAGYLGMQPMHRRWYLVPASKITISEAAEILFGEASQSSIVRIAAMIADGDLDLFINKDEPNPQRQRRVSRQQVLEMRDYIRSARGSKE